ncbi:NB-ARC domain protein [Dirofilaria immitis]|nr:NB-ARC domain protein [Dirofilaria immitis]
MVLLHDICVHIGERLKDGEECNELRLLVSLLVLITMGSICQLCQIMSLANGMSKIAGFLILFVAFFGHVWMKLESFFDESNVLETYQPRARTMGHLFSPEPPTPAPTVKFSESADEDKVKRSNEENAAFQALRDSHYANMFEYAMKMQKEMQAMEKASNQSRPNSISSPIEASTTQVSQLTSGQQPQSMIDSSSSSAEQNPSKKSSSSENKEIHV